MFLTRRVPAADPSLFHSSKPWPVWKAAKKRMDPTAVSPAGCESGEPGGRAMSRTRTVPTDDPLLDQSSTPRFPSSALKKTRSPMTASVVGKSMVDAAKVENDAMETVPAAVPSLVHRS
jgi:hypothetical protein